MLKTRRSGEPAGAGRPTRQKQSGNFKRTRRAEDAKAVRGSQRKRIGLQVTGIGGQKMKALRKESVSAEGLVLLFFCVFELFWRHEMTESHCHSRREHL